MKTKLLTSGLLILLLLGMIMSSSCSKDSDPIVEKPEESFDINNPEGYFLYFKGGGLFNSLYEFLPGKKVKTHGLSSSDISQYTVADNYIDIEGGIGSVRFVFEGDSVSSPDPYYGHASLIKPSERNQLAGKAFTGAYYKIDMSVLHPNFFYSFAMDRNTVDVGFNLGSIVRTEDYTPIGNFAARIDLGNGDKEFIVLINGKLEVNYRTADREVYYGTLAQQ